MQSRTTLAALALTWGILACSSARGDSPSAAERMAVAHRARAEWGEAFPGFTATVEANTDGRVQTGRVVVEADGTTFVDFEGDEVPQWVEGRLRSIVMHRNPGGSSADRSEADYASCKFTEAEESHPLGRQISLGDGSRHSLYRIRGDEILEVSRETENSRFTISVPSNLRNQEGRLLPQAYTVTFWDRESGDLLSSSTTWDEWKRVGDFDLPASSTTVKTRDGGRQVLQLRLTNHELSKASAAAGKR